MDKWFFINRKKTCTIMATRNVLEDNTTITSGGSTTSKSIALENETTLTIQFEGDSDSTSVSFEVQAKIDGLDEWSILEEIPAQDLTKYKNNNKLRQYDVLDLEAFRIITSNESRTETQLSIKTSHSDQQ